MSPQELSQLYGKVAEIAPILWPQAMHHVHNAMILNTIWAGIFAGTGAILGIWTAIKVKTYKEMGESDWWRFAVMCIVFVAALGLGSSAYKIYLNPELAAFHWLETQVRMLATSATS